jgi:hypothetical protein
MPMGFRVVVTHGGSAARVKDESLFGANSRPL